MINGALKLKKYIVLGRESIVHNLDGDDRRKLITEIYVRKPNTQMRGMFVEYEKCMYNEITGGRGRDVGLQEGQSFLSIDGTAQEFLDVNFKTGILETHNIRFVKTYPNQTFMSRDRSTSYHQEIDVVIDENGNGFVKDNSIKADFSTIPAGVKYLYSRATTPDGECINTTDVGYWLKNDAGNDEMLDEMSDSLDNLAPNGWSELMENTIEPDDGDFDALEKALQADPDWGFDVTFDKFLG